MESLLFHHELTIPHRDWGSPGRRLPNYGNALMLQRKQGSAQFARAFEPAATAGSERDGADDQRTHPHIRQLAAADMRASMKVGDLAGVLKALRLLSPATLDN